MDPSIRESHINHKRHPILRPFLSHRLHHSTRLLMVADSEALIAMHPFMQDLLTFCRAGASALIGYQLKGIGSTISGFV
jgi:hypothetical protein